MKIGFRWSLSRALIPVISLFAFVPLPAQTGFCDLDCLFALTNCLQTTAGCRVEGEYCSRGGPCRNGKCEDGSRCSLIWSAECAGCIEARAVCRQGCEGTYFPEITSAIRGLNLSAGQERALLVEVEKAERKVIAAMEGAVQNLEVLQQKIKAQTGKGVDEKTAAKLTDVINRTTATLQGNNVANCVSTLTTVGELIPTAGSSEKEKK